MPAMTVFAIHCFLPTLAASSLHDILPLLYSVSAIQLHCTQGLRALSARILLQELLVYCIAGVLIFHFFLASWPLV